MTLAFDIDKTSPLLSNYLYNSKSIKYINLFMIDLRYHFYEFHFNFVSIDGNILSLRILDESETEVDDLWNASMVFYSGYTSKTLEPLMEKLCSLLVISETSKFQAIRKKYTSAKLYNISTIPHLKSAVVTSMAKKAASAKN